MKINQINLYHSISKDSGHVSDSVPNRHLGSDADRPDSRENARRSRRDVHKDDDNRSEIDHFGAISTRRDVDNLSANTLNTGRSNNRRRRRRSRNRDIETRSLPPIGKPGSTTTNSTASTDKSYTNRNRHRSVSRNRSVSVNRNNDYNRRRNRSQRRKSYSKYDDNLDDVESVEGNYYAQMKIGKKDVVSKKRSNISPPKRKPTTFSRRLPAVADYHPDEYKSKRGMNSNVKLPPMSQSPSGRTFSTSDPSSLSSNGSYGSRGGVRKPRQLEPLEADISTFDSRKHRKRTQKLVEQRYR